MFKMQAPYPGVQTSTVMPSPDFGDSENLIIEVDKKLAMDGTMFTYVKRKGRRKLQWTFSLTRNKGMEVRAFIYSYHSSAILITDHNDRKWFGYFTSNPFEFETDKRAAPAIHPMPRGEGQMISIEFEGEEIL